MQAQLREVMTPDPISFQASTPVADVARAMRDHNVGDVVVYKDGKLCGIVTDRDIVVRALAEGKDPKKTHVDAICSHEIVTISTNQSLADAVKLMRDRAIRRLPVVENNLLVGIISLGDLALQLDRKSALGDISAAPPTH